tara:strand:+ start:702 stop:1157 length:456 start_codon:yes stop_codon:yes gene_type:complete
MVNKVVLVGRLGKDPEVRHLSDTSSVCNFTLATNESYKDRQGNRVDQTEWHNITIWRPGLVGVAEKYLQKGKLIYLEGKLKTRAWDDKDGNKRYTTEVHVDQLQMLERSQDSSPAMTPQNTVTSSNSSQGGQSIIDSPASNAPKVDDDLPF